MGRLVAGAVLFLVYAAPLYWPPAPLPPGTASAPDAWALERIVPGVPGLWVAIRMAALALAAVLLSSPRLPDHPISVSVATPWVAPLPLRLLALVVGVVHCLVASRAARLDTVGQCVYLAALFLPAALLALSQRPWPLGRAVRWQLGAPVAALVAAWVALSVWRDVQSPRAADVVDGWLGFLASVAFATEHKNLLTDAYDPRVPGVGGVIALLHGAPLFASGLARLTFARVQLLQLAWLATSALGLAYLGRILLGRGAGIIAAAVLLFAPFTRFAALFPGPFIVGPVYTIALGLLLVRAVRQPSEAVLAALGAMAGIAVTYPGVIPVVALFGLVTSGLVVRNWRSLWVGALVGLVVFAAAVLPLFPNVLSPDVFRHVRWQGASVVANDAALIGQVSLRAHQPLTHQIVSRPLDVVVGALLAPFVHLRFAVRLFGDAIFDPLGAALAAVGLVTCVRALRRSTTARFLLLFFLAALSPALASPLDVVDVTHALVLPVAVALLAAAGWRTLSDRIPGARRTAGACAAAMAIGATLLFDVVTPRIISASSAGIMFSVLDPSDARRAVWIGYDEGVIPWARELFQADIARWTGPAPVAFVAYSGGRFPGPVPLDEGKSLLFWSRGMHDDYAPASAICRRWPDARLFEIWDRAHVGRAYAAVVAGAAWTPRAAEGSWETWDCEAQRQQRRTPLP